MLNDLFEVIGEGLGRVLGSRLFILAAVFTLMFVSLGLRLFNLQIVQGEELLDDYVHMTEKTVRTLGTRGNIYDRNGYLLAYNELAYSVVVSDTGTLSGAAMNRMLLKLVRILNEHGYTAQGRMEIAMDDEGNMVFTTSSETARLRFLRDFYGLRSTDDLDDARGRYPSAVTAAGAVDIKAAAYDLDRLKDEKGSAVILTDAEKMQIVNIRYTMSLVAYRRFETSTVCERIDEETVADLMEHLDELTGVSIEETTIRRYSDAVYFAPIIGYTGKVQEEQLKELQEENPDYDLNDIVGRIGIEASMEYELQGHKGYRQLIVNNVGNILEVVEETPASTGNDVYLTIDRDLQIGIYHLIEQQLAGIVASKLVNHDVDLSEVTDSSKIEIPVKDAYYQLINNNVLSVTAMASEDAGEIEREIYSRFDESREEILRELQEELLSEDAALLKDLPRDMLSYMVYIYTYLSDPSVGIIDTDSLEKTGESYQAWKNDEISLRDFLYAGISESWVDTTKLETESKYSSADDIYRELVDYVLAALRQDTKFTKRIFRYLINDSVVTGRQLCLALYAQGVLAWDDEAVRLLTVNGEDYAYTFIKEKITNIEITPAQLALDPCTGGVVVTDVNTGEVRALVTYPSYDNNRLTGSADPAYLNQLREDLSLPLYNNATQAKKAPGSTFKPITAIAGLEEGVVGLYETIECTGNYDEVTNPIKCWIYPGRHGELTLQEGIMNSCNYYFAEVAHRLSTDASGNYSTDRGLAVIRKYASLFGLDRTSGIEISETTPELSTEDPERTAMGQGTNSFSNVQLSRYVAALANRGTVFNLSLIDKITDPEGGLIEDLTPQIANKIEISDSTWDAVQAGMRAVISDGSASRIFRDLEVDIAGKTGTAQETRTRGNHAFFISYGPYSDPEISVTVNIPYGYSSSNAATVAADIYRFYYGYIDLDYILNTGALDVSNVSIGD